MEDRTLLSTFVVSNTDDSGPGSLRQAILDSNASTDATNTIEFNIADSGVQTIFPRSPLPTITTPVLIDGFSEPGYTSTPQVEINGSLSSFSDGLTISASEVSVRGLDINNFNYGAAIHLTGAGANGDWIYGNFLGTDLTGTLAEPNDEGVEIDGGATDSLIGSNGDGMSDAAERNLLSGNSFAGVWITGQGTKGNVVAGNLIGTSITGDVALDNGTSPRYYSYGIIGGGVVIEGAASGNRIGTDGNSVDDVGERNVIAGSNNDAVDIFGAGTDGNVVAGNFIGTDVSSTVALGIAGDGVFIDAGAASNWIGVNPTGGAEAADEGNVISGNGYDGVQVYVGSDNNVIAGDEIGTDVTGAVALGNSSNGVEIDFSSGNTIGGATPVAGNLITNNGRAGVAVGSSSVDDAVGNQITANRIYANQGQAIDLGADRVTDNGAVPRQGPNYPVVSIKKDTST